MTSFIDRYHILYEESKIWNKNKWLDIPCYKLPFDMQVIQELIVKQRPDWIIETGSAYGGSAAFYASICDLIGKGNVVTIDIESKIQWEEIQKYKFTDRIKFINGSSINKLVVDKAKELVYGNCMVILDSWHTEEHVYQEMIEYSGLVPVNGYMIVEDTHAGNPGNPIEWKYDDRGPKAAVDRWLKENDNWMVDYECEKHLMSFNKGGYLKRIR